MNKQLRWQQKTVEIQRRKGGYKNNAADEFI